MLELSYPWALTLLIAPILVYLLTPARKEQQNAMQLPQFQLLAEVSGQVPSSGVVTQSRTFMQKGLLAFGWICLVIAIAKPVWIAEPIERQKSARDIMVALDLSGSMIKKDFYSSDGKKVTRLEAAKKVLTEFATQRTHDRLGLLLFGDEPYLQAPMTNQIDVWTELLSTTSLGVAGWQTAIGDAIGLSIKVFEQEKTSNPVLVLLSDGNDTVSKMSPVAAAKVAKRYGIKIHTVAMGDPKAEGDYRVDISSLKSIAEITGGNSFQAQNRQQLEQIYSEIDKLEPAIYKGESYRPKISLHYLPVALYMIVNLLMFMPTMVRRYKKITSHRTAKMGLGVADD